MAMTRNLLRFRPLVNQRVVAARLRIKQFNKKREYMSEIRLSDAKGFMDSIKRIKPFQSTEETRYYLCGIYFEVIGEKLVLTATDGHTLMQEKLAIEEVQPGFKPVIISSDDINALLQILKTKDGALLISQANEKVAFSTFPVEYICRPVQGSYPDYQKVIPKDFKKTSCGFNASYVKKITQAFKNKPINIKHDDESSPHLVTCTDMQDSLCVIMPMRA